MEKCGHWKLLRTKSDPTTDDTDWVGTNAEPAEADTDSLPPEFGAGYAVTGVEVCVLAIDNDRVLKDRSNGTVDVQLIKIFDRTVVALGGAAGLEKAVVDDVAAATLALNRSKYMPTNGATLFTVRITADANLPAGTTKLEVWYREVFRTTA